jgi:ParB/RepB/Spo0J family partition protein
MSLPQPLSAHDLATADAQALHAETDGYYGQFELSKLRASPDNRKRFNEQALQELAESIKTMGVAQAILIRPVTPTEDAPEVFEIVAGERRFRASKLAGKTTIPALCRPLSNLDAAKIRILENLQREDPHPMEEAEGYQLLMLQHGFTADQLVDEVKKSRAYIYGRLKLCALTTEVRELFLDDKLSASTALLVARIPVPALQIKAAEEILKPDWQGNTMSHRSAASHIQNRYMLKLGAAVFSLTDAKLLATAGSCVKCPKRAGNQPELFEGIDANVCTDPDCFAEKKAAHGAALLVQANKKGIPVLEGEEGDAVMRTRWNRDSDLVTADMSLFYFSRNAPSTQNNGYVNDYLNEGTLPPVAGYRKGTDGVLTALYKRADVQDALEAAGACETAEVYEARMREAKETPPVMSPKQQAEQKAREAKQALVERENVYRLSLYKQLRARVTAAGLSLPALRELTKAVVAEHDLDSSLHDLYESDVSTDLDGYIDTADAAALQLLLMDVIFGQLLEIGTWDLMNDGSVDDQDGFSNVVAMARHEGVDVDAVRNEVFPPKPEAPTAPDQGKAGTGSPAVQYRNPKDPGQAWTGRGKQPKWVSEWIQSGKSLDALRVDMTPAVPQPTSAWPFPRSSEDKPDQVQHAAAEVAA